jgi:hypothetical protein
VTIYTINWEAIFTTLGVIAELLVAWGICYEWEGGKLFVAFLRRTDESTLGRAVVEAVTHPLAMPPE